LKHTISCMVENKFGVLARVAGLFSSRGFNINSLEVGETEDPTVSRMTIVVDADDRILEQVIKQLHKLIDVIKVTDLTGKDLVDRELILVRVDVKDASARTEITQITELMKAKVADVDQKSMIVEMTGQEKEISKLLELLRPFGIKELARTGKLSMVRK
jgi:acetolactate synthase I/III small subunit